MASATQVAYYDPDGKKQTGWYINGHVYEDEAGETPIAVGSTYRSESGKVYRQTRYGGVLWAAPKSVDQNGAWVRQGDPWYQTAQDLLIRQENRPAFSYDPETDPLWQSAKSQALVQGRRAMEDTVGRTAALSGGYASSYAGQLGEQAYRASLGELGKLLPELFDRARAQYDAETKDLIAQIDAALGLYDSDYRTYLDALEAARWQQDFDRDNDHWQQDFDRDNAHWQQDFDRDNAHWQAELEQAQAQWEAKQAAAAASGLEADQKTARSYAYRMAMLALQHGLSVSSDMLAAAGIDPAYAARIRAYFANH